MFAERYNQARGELRAGTKVLGADGPFCFLGGRRSESLPAHTSACIDRSAQRCNVAVSISLPLVPLSDLLNLVPHVGAHFILFPVPYLTAYISFLFRVFPSQIFSSVFFALRVALLLPWFRPRSPCSFQVMLTKEELSRVWVPPTVVQKEIKKRPRTGKRPVRILNTHIVESADV